MPKDQTLPLISIITPSFNAVRYIEEAILSVQKQNYPHFEHIIVDGASTDGTVEILQRYSKSVRWISEPDNGQSDALNKAIRMSRGSVIGWLNADDTFEGPDVFIEVAKAFTKYPDAGLVYADCNIVDDQGRITGISRAEPFDFSKHIIVNQITPVSAFWCRHLIEDAGLIDTSLNYVMDYELWIRYALKTKMKQIPGVWGNYRLSKGSKTTSCPACYFVEMLTVYESLFSNQILPIEIQSRKQEVFGCAHWQAGLNYYAQHNDVDGEFHCRQAIKEYRLIQNNYAFLIQTLVHIALHGSPWGQNAFVDQADEYVRRVLSGIDKLEGFSPKLRNDIWSQLYCANAFILYKSNQVKHAATATAKAILLAPSLINNVGLLSILIEVTLGHKVVNTLRRLRRVSGLKA